MKVKYKVKKQIWKSQIENPTDSREASQQVQISKLGQGIELNWSIHKKGRSASGGSFAEIDLQIHKEKIENLTTKKKESYTVQFYTHRPSPLLIIQVANYRIITHFEPIKLLLSRALLLIDILSCH